MGNAVSPCIHPDTNSEPVNLIFWEGNTRTLGGAGGGGGGGLSKKRKKWIAGEIMFEFPDKMVCHADSFFLGRPIPFLSVEDELVPGQTYFVLPVDFFPPTLSASALAALGSSSSSSSSPKPALMDFGEDGPFQYVKGDDGRPIMKVSPDFIMRIIAKGKAGCHRDDGKDPANMDSSRTGSLLCSTPELREQYKRLVRYREQVWLPKLETISEHKIRHSPCRFTRSEWKLKEKGK